MKTALVVLICFALLAPTGMAGAFTSSDENETPPTINADLLTAPMRLGGEMFAASGAKISNERWIFLLYINGTPVAMADAQKEGTGWNARVLETQAELRSAVRLYHASVGNLGMARKELEAAQEIVRKYNSSRARENACLQALGLKQRPCSDFDSCLKSCYSSVEFCQPLAQANGRKFIDQISDYQNKSAALTNAIAKSEVEYQTAWEKVGSVTLGKYNASLTGIWFASAEMLRHPFSGPLCQKPFYDSAAAPSIQAHLQKALEWIEPVEDGGPEAERIANAMAERKAAKQNESIVIGIDISNPQLPKLEGGMIALIGFVFAICLIGLLAWKMIGKFGNPPVKSAEKNNNTPSVTRGDKENGS